jgi:hypothetical protein
MPDITKKLRAIVAERKAKEAEKPNPDPIAEVQPEPIAEPDLLDDSEPVVDSTADSPDESSVDNSEQTE